MTGPWRRTAGGIELRIRLTPRGGRDAIEGVVLAADGAAHVAARVRAVPEDGKANAALEKLVAGTLGVPGRDVSVVSGMTSRIKTVAVAGDPDLLAARAAAATRSRG